MHRTIIGYDLVKNIGIIGGGFSGTMTAVHLIRLMESGSRICIIDRKNAFNRGIAYQTSSTTKLLNVIASRMSAFTDKPSHFLDWVMKRPEFKNMDTSVISVSFLPRSLYGEYLDSIWDEAAQTAKKRNISVEVIDSQVVRIESKQPGFELQLENGRFTAVDDCVLATGNQIPANPPIQNPSFYQSSKYYRNPWQSQPNTTCDTQQPVLILGNGLTMVDIVLSLTEQGHTGLIYTISPHGFKLLPHRHIGLTYAKITDELSGNASLLDLLKLVNKHTKAVGNLGMTAEPVIDALRPFTQQFWKGFSEHEKQVFLSRLCYLWGIGRHRIPGHIYDRMLKLKTDGRLVNIAGRVLELMDAGNHVEVKYSEESGKNLRSFQVSTVINCTGPETDISRLENSVLKECLEQGILVRDRFGLGMRANPETFEVLNARGLVQANLYTLGSNLRGEIWESTAVGEIRDQAEKLALRLIN